MRTFRGDGGKPRLKPLFRALLYARLKPCSATVSPAVLFVSIMSIVWCFSAVSGWVLELLGLSRPTLRKVREGWGTRREGWGTRLVGCALRIGWGIRLFGWGGCLVAGLGFFLPGVAGLLAAQESRAFDPKPAIAQLMAGKSGAVVVVGVASGKILAQSHLEIAAQRLTYPGSTLKPFILMELLSSGRVKPEQRLMCRRPLFVGGRRMDCVHPEGVEVLDAPDAIAYSCNAYFAAVAGRLSGDELAQVLRRAGFTSQTHLAPEEAAGTVTRAQNEAELQLQALGHWGIEVTPLELLAAYRALALQKLRSHDLGTASPVFDGMERAVRYGVASAARPHRMTAAGKTGTASGRTTRRTHGFFVGYAPADKPEIAIVVYLEQGRGMDAAAVAGKIFDAYWK